MSRLSGELGQQIRQLVLTKLGSKSRDRIDAVPLDQSAELAPAKLRREGRLVDRRRVAVVAAFLPPRYQPLLVQAHENRHDGRVGQLPIARLVQGGMNLGHGLRSGQPQPLHHAALQRAQESGLDPAGFAHPRILLRVTSYFARLTRPCCHSERRGAYYWACSTQHRVLVVRFMSLLRACLDWRVLVGLATVGLAVFLIAPNIIAAAVPLLLIAACPLSMILMMRTMAIQERGMDQPPDLALGTDRVAGLRAQLEASRREEARLARELDHLESTGSRIVGEANPARE